MKKLTLGFFKLCLLTLGIGFLITSLATNFSIINTDSLWEDGIDRTFFGLNEPERSGSFTTILADFDNDGLDDLSDLDDDNDGILDVDEGCVGQDVDLGVDGTFEALAGIASSDAYNSNVTAGGWFNGVGSADSWISPMPTTGTGVWGGLADGTPSSPDGGVFIGAWARGTGRESFYIDLTGLIIGQDYILKFYQANAGVEGSTVLGNNARWEVHFGTQVQFSPEMPYLGEGNQVWQEETMQFTASQTTQRLEFFSDDAADGTPGTSRDCIAIDGVRLFEAASTSTACTGQDTDGDGSPDHLDNDADGDGCPDALEGTGTFVIGDLDANDQLTGGVDANGIPLVATASGQGLGSSNDPGVQSCPPPPPSATDNALSFNSNDWVGVANASDFNVGASTDFTIQGIVQTTFDAPGASRTIFSKMQNGSIQGYQLWAWQGKLLLEWAKNGSINLLGGTTTIADGQCHHVAVVVDRSAETVKLYVDGVLDATQNNTDISSDINNSADVFIGKERTNNSAFFWRGEIDELAFFTSARSDAEIAQSASNALTGSEAGLLAYWKFDSGVAGADNSGVTTAIDETGGNDGTLNGFSLDGTETETGANGTVVTGTWVASSCSVDPSGLQFVVGTETSGPSNTVIVPITVNDFDDVATYQGTITFDPNVLTFVDATSPLPGGTSSFGDPGQGTIPNNSITFSWYDPGFNTSSLPDGTVVMELEFTVASNATTGFTDVQINGSATPLGYSTDPAATVLSDPTVTQGGVTIDADAPTVDVINIVSNNANDITLATIADVITLSFTTSETPAQAPVVTIVEGGTGAVTLGGSGTSYTATKTVATGGDGLVTFSIQIEDQYGNSSTATATTDGSQVIVDTEDPTITCPADVNEDTDAGVCGRVVSFTDPVGADNLPGHSVAQTGGPASGSTFPVGTTTITYTVTDAAGNTATCDFDITITDNEAPNVITQPFTVQLDANGSASISVNDIDNGSSDACGIATSVLDITSFSCADLGNNTVTLTVTDVNGNSASATAVVTVEDVIPPTITCPAPQTISTDLGLCTAALPDLTGLATVDDNCEGTGGSGNGVVSPATKLAMGSFHSLAVADDGTLWSWGSNFFGKLGIGSGNSSFNQTSPAQASSSTDWEAVAAGGNHSLALKTDGTLWAWGFNSSGQLGTGNNTQQNSPVQVGSDTDWAMVRAGANHSMALKTDGTLWAWGVNQNGTLGIGNTNNQNSPVQVGTDTDWILISAGIQHSAALKSDGTAWAWGANDDGALGIGNTITQNSPVQIGTDTDWASISAGGDNADQHTIALKSDGSLWAWGTNDDGELGNGSSSGIATSPIQVGSDTDWAMAQAGANHSMALKSDGTFWFWGSRANGVSGTGGNTSSNETSPIQSGNSSDWLEFGIGNANHIIALQNNNSLFGWGFNSAGQVGKGNTSSANVPFAVTGFTPQASGSGLGSSSGSSSGLTVTQSPAVGTPLAVGPHTVTITVTDASGNTASCDVSVTVEDNEAPTVVTQNIIVQLDASGNASITAAQVDGGSTDPCGIASITVSPETFTCGDVGVNQVTLTVTDVNGNVATGTAAVTLPFPEASN
ncbi:MAG: HYR domain-containing protein [Bacteroidota bacterium]